MTSTTISKRIASQSHAYFLCFSRVDTHLCYKVHRYKGIHGEAQVCISVEFSIRNSRTYFARVAREGLKSSKLGLLTLL